MEQTSVRLNPLTEGDARTGEHAQACGRHGGRGCGMSCRCWCHGITTHIGRDPFFAGPTRADAEATRAQ